MLNDCQYIRNLDGCVYDTNTGYKVAFNKTLDGWDQYSGAAGTHSVGYFLWLIADSSEVCLGRSTALTTPFEADFFPSFALDIMIESAYLTEAAECTARLWWKTVADVMWPDDSYYDFTVKINNTWERYTINLLEHPKWVGDCETFKLYLFLGDNSEVSIYIKRMAFVSSTFYRCNYGPCAGNRSYRHPCPHVGTFAVAKALQRITVPNINATKNRIGVSIDNYPLQYIDIDLNQSSNVWTIAQAITLRLNSIGIGGFKFAECLYDEIEQVYSIQTGTRGAGGCVEIQRGNINDAAVELGFFTNAGFKTYIVTGGMNPADGFQSRFYKLTASTRYNLANSITTVFDYKPELPLVVVGRPDLARLGMGRCMERGSLRGLLMVDIFGTCNYFGIINNIWYRGKTSSFGSTIYHLRPQGELCYQVINSVVVTDLQYKATLIKLTVSWNVLAGDVLGLYQCKPAVHKEDDSPEEQFYKYSWLEKRLNSISIGDVLYFTKQDLKFNGFESLPVYGFSNSNMLEVGLDVKLMHEYGVDSVAIIGEPLVGSLLVDLTKLPSTMLGKTPPGNTTLFPVTESNYVIDPELYQGAFYIDFFFPSTVYNICKFVIEMDTPDVGLRGFCWEYQVDDDDRYRYSWVGYEDGYNIAPRTGSEYGWKRLDDPLSVVTDGKKNQSESMYLKYNYVTDDPDDEYPLLSESEQNNRLRKASSTKWSKIEQFFGYVHTKAIRLNCWRAFDTSLSKISIYTQFNDVQAMVNSIEGVGISGPLVFDTEVYNIINIIGEKYSSSKISRIQTEDYIYPLSFVYYDLNTAIAPVGTTLSRLQIIFNELPISVHQIKIIPQQLAVRIHAESGEPITEITELSWGMPHEGWTYGPSRKYKVCNDRGVPARLLLDIANPMVTEQACVFDSSLSSSGNVTDPYRGFAMHHLESSDYVFSNDHGINYRSIVYDTIPLNPLNWYSSTTSGTVWHLLTSGSPFTYTTNWTEPANPENPIWKIYAAPNAEELEIGDGKLLISMLPRRPVLDGFKWVNPTYFIEIGPDEPILIETQLHTNLEFFEGVDISAGIVLFDKTNTENYFKIEYLTQQSGESRSYVSYGSSVQYYADAFAKIDISSVSIQDILFRFNKYQDRIDVGYRFPWTTWTTVSSTSFVSLSTMGIGIFIGATETTEVQYNMAFTAEFNYLSYKKSSDRIVDRFNYDFSLSLEDSLVQDWTAINLNRANLLMTSVTGITIHNKINYIPYTDFDFSLTAPAVGTTWGSVMDRGLVSYNLNPYVSNSSVSGSFCAGILLNDSAGNYLQYILNSQSSIAVRTNDTEITTSISGYATTSGIWFKLFKAYGSLIPSYSFNNIDYEVVSGYDITSWNNLDYLSLNWSSAWPEVVFSDVQIANSQEEANAFMVEFEDYVSLYDVWRRGCVWENIKYAASGTTTFTTTKPDVIHAMSFTVSGNAVLDRANPVFMPDMYKSNANGLFTSAYGIAKASETLFNLSSYIRPEIMTKDSTGALSAASSFSDNSLSQVAYPLLIIDLGGEHEIGRYPLAANNATGYLSRTFTSYINEVQFEPIGYGYSGFNRKCFFSTNNICTAPPNIGDPTQVFLDYDEKNHYYPGECNGRETPAGLCFRACPLFSLGKARWLRLEYPNKENITLSGGANWFFGPIWANPKDNYYPIASFDPWWITDYGGIYWDEVEGSNYNCIMYNYPGLGIEGSCFFNYGSSPYWRLSNDANWTYEDSFVIDLKVNSLNTVEYVKVKVGCDYNCYYEFIIAGYLLQKEWVSHSIRYKEAELVIKSGDAINEPSYTVHDAEYYEWKDYPRLPMPFLNIGYVEVLVKGSEPNKIYFKDLRNVRTRFDNGMLFLGINEALYIPIIDLISTGTVEFDYLPSPAALNFIPADPREYVLDIVSVSTQQACISARLHPTLGWQLFVTTPKEDINFSVFTSYEELISILPALPLDEPFHIVLSWSGTTLPSRIDNIVLWVNGVIVCSAYCESLKGYFNGTDMRVTLGKGAKTFEEDDVSRMRVAYAYFSNLKIYKFPVGNPNIQFADFSTLPEGLIELSLDNTNWSNYLDNNLPVKTDLIPHSECVEFYVRNRIPSAEIKRSFQRSTAYLSVAWEVVQ